LNVVCGTWKTPWGIVTMNNDGSFDISQKKRGT